MKLKIIIPTRQRREKFFSTLYKAQQNIVLPDTTFHITLDSDDYVMNRKEVQDILKKYGNLKYKYGKSESKIHAVNRDMESIKNDADIFLLLSDDMVPVVKGFDKVIVDRMKEYFPDTDGALWFNDGNEDGNPPTKDLNTLVCLGRKYYDRFGYLYYPEYKSFFCDNEYTEVGKQMGKLIHLPEIIIEHQHPLFNSGKKANVRTDVLYIKNNKHWKTDEDLYFKRKETNFGLPMTTMQAAENLSNELDNLKTTIVDKVKDIMGITDGNMDDGIVEKVLPESDNVIPETKPLLSILIPTVNGREDKLNELLKILNTQIQIGGHENNVEIIQLKDNKEMTLGAKRNKLYQMANGYYSVQIDDDDMVSHYYIDSVITAIVKEKPDCIGYKELCIWDGKRVESSVFSKKYTKWADNFDGFNHVRSPFYKCPIKTEIALQVEIPSLRFGEDHEQSKKIYPLLKTETFIDDFMYIYRHSSNEPHDIKYGFKTQLV